MLWNYCTWIMEFSGKRVKVPGPLFFAWGVPWYWTASIWHTISLLFNQDFAINLWDFPQNKRTESLLLFAPGYSVRCFPTSPHVYYTTTSSLPSLRRLIVWIYLGSFTLPCIISMLKYHQLWPNINSVFKVLFMFYLIWMNDLFIYEERKDMKRKDYKFLSFLIEWCENKSFKIDVTLN